MLLPALFVSVLAHASMALAQQAQLQRPPSVVIRTICVVEEWDRLLRTWVAVEETSRDPHLPGTCTDDLDQIATARSAPDNASFARSPEVRRSAAYLARFGPFHVLDSRRAAIVGSTDVDSPAHFDAMMRAHPSIEVLEFLDASGTTNDLANLSVGRKIRAAGLATHIPDGGSARSGAVELFVAGARKSYTPQALFAVHAWRDNRGREPNDFAQDAPENRMYLDYYIEMGMNPQQALAFYSMTNSVPHSEAKWLTGAEMRRWLRSDEDSHQINNSLAFEADRDPVLPSLSFIPRAMIVPGGSVSVAAD